MTKAIAAVIMSIIGLIELWTGESIVGLDQNYLETIIFVLTPVVVWLIPNDWLSRNRLWRARGD